MTAPTLQFASILYGAGGVPLDDPAENYHEAARLYPSAAGRQMIGVAQVSAVAELQQTVERAVRRHGGRPAVPLGRVRLPRSSLARALRARRSALPRARSHVGRAQLSSILAAAYRARPREGVARRPVPSAGALYPCELYVIALDVGGIDGGVYHYDPVRHVLERLRLDDPSDELARALVDETLVARASAAIVTTGMFWRSRFKYGLRGYRFTLLEAGHLAQNLVLAAAALRLSALPLGGFYDRRVDDLLGVDGVDESAVHITLLGGAA